jgi:tetratricopeptide (TPR) repeat protein
VGLVLLTLTAYGPVLRAGFIWDDDSHVTTNATLTSLSGLGRIWLDPSATPQYYPLVHTTFWLEYHLWGLDPLGYHIVNLLLHVGNALLLWRLLRRLGVPGALMAAALFALHPVQVESVAWVSERKNVLSTLCYLGSFLALLRFWPPEVARPSPAGRWLFYVLAVLLFLAALLAKTVTCSLPAAFLLVRWWKQGRLSRGDLSVAAPLLLLGLGLSLNTVFLEKVQVGAHGAEWDRTAVERVLIAGRAVWFYAGKLAWPASLTFIYPRWPISAEAAWQYGFPLAVLAVLAGLYRLRGRLGRGPVVAVLYFVGTLVPALGFFDVYPMRFSFVADHFQYLASAGLFALAAAAGQQLLARASLTVRPATLARVVPAAVLALLVWRQADVYQNAMTLWTDTVEKNPGSWMAWYNRGVLYEQVGQVGLAVHDHTRAIQLKPDFAEAHTNRGNLYLALGQAKQAAEDYSQAIAARPEAPEPYADRGVAYQQLGKIEEAVAECTRAIERKPDFTQAYANRGLFQHQLGRLRLAVSDYTQALALEGDRAEVYNNRGVAYQQLGRHGQALEDFHQAQALKPDFAQACLNEAASYYALKRYPEARQSIKRGRDLGGTPDPKLMRNLLMATGRPGGKVESGE